MASFTSLPSATAWRRSAKRASARTGEPFGVNRTMRPIAYSAPRSRVRPRSASLKTNASSADRKSSKGASWAIWRKKLPDDPYETLTDLPVLFSNATTISSSANFRSDAAAITGPSAPCAAAAADHHTTTSSQRQSRFIRR